MAVNWEVRKDLIAQRMLCPLHGYFVFLSKVLSLNTVRQNKSVVNEGAKRNTHVAIAAVSWQRHRWKQEEVAVRQHRERKREEMENTEIKPCWWDLCDVEKKHGSINLGRTTYLGKAMLLFILV